MVLKKIIFAAMLISSSLAYSYVQRITSHVINNSKSALKVCFISSDLFDKPHCLEDYSHLYKRGPKNWSFSFYPLLISVKVQTDSSCKNFSDRTPEQIGELDLYVQADDTVIHTDAFTNYKAIRFSNCRAVWTAHNN